MIAAQDVVLFFMFLLTLGTMFTVGDPCLQALDEPPDMFRRFVAYETDIQNGEIDICDKYQIPVEGKWYRAYIHMPTEAPQLFSCGTTHPIWYLGDLPVSLNDLKSGTGCMVSDGDACAEMYPIKVQKCENYYAYHLVATRSCPVAYCFGLGNADPPPENAPPTPTVIPHLVYGGDRKREVLMFECFFGASQGLTYNVYQVTWFIEGTGYTYVANKSELYKLWLSVDVIGRLNRNVKCMVRAKNAIDGIPGPASGSDDFYAGVKVTPSTVFLTSQNASANVALDLTVPFGCIRRHDNDNATCGLTFQMLVPTGGINTKCTESEISTEAQFCRYIIKNDEWNKKHEITIRYKRSEKNSLSLANSYITKLEVSTTDRSWNGYTTDIYVNIQDSIDPRIAKRVCRSRNDPHMTTFDGRNFEMQTGGIFTLYEYDDTLRKMQVIIETENCIDSRYTHNFCNCGIAVRAGGDVFIVNICKKRHIMEYRTCHDKILDVRRMKGNELLYSIFFPTGTRVDISWSIGQFNVDIRASGHDIRKTKGLCGFLSFTCTDDFKLRDGSTSSSSSAQEECKNQHHTKLHPKDYWESWQISRKSENDFFELPYDAAIDRWADTNRYCRCPKEVQESCGVDNNCENYFECSPEATTECVRNMDFDKLGSKTCQAKPGRKLRSLEFPIIGVETRIEKISRKSSVEKFVFMTPEESIQYCKDFFQSAAIFNLCSDIPNVPTDTSLEICALDIQLTNSTSWTERTLEALKGACVVEVRLNTTLDENPDNDTKSISEVIRGMFCPGTPECSNSGQCINGSCVCNLGFVGSDCSIDITNPPLMFGLRGDGVCDTREIECSTAFLVGERVGSSDDLSCQVKKYQITADGQKSYVSSVIGDGQLETLMEVHCLVETPQSRRKHAKQNLDVFVDAYTISISYDRKNFGEEFDYVVIDSLCQSSDNITGEISLKSDTCFIGRHCYLRGQGHTTNTCLYCDSSIPFQWTTRNDLAECSMLSEDQSSENLAWIAGPVIGAVVCLFIGIVIAVRLTKHTSGIKDISSSELKG